MSVSEAVARAAAPRESRNRGALVAAYRQGLGLVAVSVIRGAAGIRIAAEDGKERPATGEAVVARCWCRSAAEARRVANAAMAGLRRRQSKDGSPSSSDESQSRLPDDIAGALLLAEKTIATAAKRSNVSLYTDAEICAEAGVAAASVDAQIERLRQAGELRSINRSYWNYRMEASARGEKILRYADWFSKYRENLVRQLAAALRYS